MKPDDISKQSSNKMQTESAELVVRLTALEDIQISTNAPISEIIDGKNKSLSSDSSISDRHLNSATRSETESFEKSIHEDTSHEWPKNVSSSFEEVPEIIRHMESKEMSNELRPQNAMNRKDANLCRPSYVTCKFYLGTFLISPEEFNEMYKSESLVDGRWTYVLSVKFSTVNNICILNIKQKRYLSSKNCLKIYGYCAHKRCNVFLLYLKDFRKPNSHHEVSVYSSSLDYNHLKPITRYLKGDHRKISKIELKLVKASKSRERRVLESSSLSIKAGNMDHVKSDSVLRKVRSEVLGHNDRHKDDIFDLCLMQRTNDEYIKSVGQPFHVYIYSMEQLKIALKNEGFIILHLDATGNVHSRPKFVKQRPFYYAGVIVSTFNQRIVPILEMYNCQHDTTSIGIWLAKFKAFCIHNKKKWPLFKRVVTDFSFALINATLRFLE